MNWTWPFGTKPREAMAAVPLALLSEPRAANWGARDASALIRDGYLRNAVANRCVRMVAEAAASILLRTQHEGAARLMRQPGPEMAQAGFLEAVFSELLLSGNAFVEAVRLPGETEVAALFPLRSGAVRPLVDARGWAEGRMIRGRNGQERSVRRDAEGWMPVLQVKFYHPADDVIGLPPLAAARRALDLHNASADWAKPLIDNAAKPSDALVYGGDTHMTPDQFDRLKEELEANFAGAANAGQRLWRAYRSGRAGLRCAAGHAGAAGGFQSGPDHLTCKDSITAAARRPGLGA